MKLFKDIKQNHNVVVRKEGLNGFGGTVFHPVTRKGLNFILSSFGGFEHLSVSTPSRCPTWDEMCFMKDTFFDKDEVCYQLHPAEKDYINNHPYCLHIWKSLNVEIPQPPRFMVGIKDESDVQELLKASKEYTDGVKE